VLGTRFALIARCTPSDARPTGASPLQSVGFGHHRAGRRYSPQAAYWTRGPINEKAPSGSGPIVTEARKPKEGPRNLVFIHSGEKALPSARELNLRDPAKSSRIWKFTDKVSWQDEPLDPTLRVPRFGPVIAEPVQGIRPGAAHRRQARSTSAPGGAEPDTKPAIIGRA
jgi:hypothetical protein